MSTIRHLLAKDARRFFGVVALWVVLLVLSSVGVLGHVDHDDLFGVGLRVRDIVRAALAVVTPLVFVLGVAALVVEDPVPGTRGFWLTRAISRSHMSAAKVGWTVIFLALPMLVIHATTMWALGVGWPDIAAMMLEGLLVIAVVTTLTLVVASVSRSLTQFVAFAVGLVATATTAFGLWAAVALRSSVERPVRPQVPEPTDVASPLVWAAVFTVGLGLVTLQQYRARRSWMTGMSALAVVVTAFVAAALWPWPIRAVGPHLPDWAANLTLTIDRSSTAIGTDPWMGRRGGSRLTIVGRPQVAGAVPGTWAMPQVLEGWLELRDGTSLGGPVWPAGGSGVVGPVEANPEWAALVDAIEAARVAVPPGYSGRFPVSTLPIVTIPEAASSTVSAQTSMRYRGSALIHVMEWWVDAAAPLRPGVALVSAGRTLTVDSWRRSPGFVTLAATALDVRRFARTLPVSQQYQLALRHRGRDEAVIGQIDVNRPAVIGGGALFGFPGAPSVAVSPVAAAFTTGSETGPRVTLDDAWLAGAELVVLTAHHIGSAETRVDLPDFTWPGPPR